MAFYNQANAPTTMYGSGVYGGQTGVNLETWWAHPGGFIVAPVSFTTQPFATAPVAQWPPVAPVTPVASFGATGFSAMNTPGMVYGGVVI